MSAPESCSALATVRFFLTQGSVSSIPPALPEGFFSAGGGAVPFDAHAAGQLKLILDIAAAALLTCNYTGKEVVQAMTDDLRPSEVAEA